MRSPTTQPDLFGEADNAEARAQTRREWNASPQTCPLCGLTEPTGFRLSQHHILGYGPFPEDQRIYTVECLPMYLTRNHVLYGVEHRSGDELARDVASARGAWANRLDDLRASLAAHGIDLDELP